MFHFTNIAESVTTQHSQCFLPPGWTSGNSVSIKSAKESENPRNSGNVISPPEWKNSYMYNYHISHPSRINRSKSAPNA